MTRLRILLSRLLSLVRSRRMDREIDDEIASHLAEATDEYIAQGLSPEEARWAALRSFGGVTQTKEVYRHVRSFMFAIATMAVALAASWIPAYRASRTDAMEALRRD